MSLHLEASPANQNMAELTRPPLAPRLDINKITMAEVNGMPWKYLGYKEYSEFIVSDNELFLLRRFRTLNVRDARRNIAPRKRFG